MENLKSKCKDTFSSVLVAQKTTEQANIVGETAVSGANQVSEKAVESLETVVASTGLVKPVRISYANNWSNEYWIKTKKCKIIKLALVSLGAVQMQK